MSDPLHTNGGRAERGDRFLVLLAAYNGAAYLQEQIHSVLAQVGVRVNIVVSLDPSTDGSDRLLRELAAADSRVSLLPALPASGGAAQNFFRLLRDAEFAACDYVCFCDQDDIWLPDKLSRAASVLRSTGAAGYSSDVTAFWPDGREVRIVKSQPQQRWDHWFEAAGPGCTYVLTRPLALALQQVVRQHWPALRGVALHDWFSYAYARQHGHPWVIDSFSGIRYRQHGNNEFGANVGWRSAWSRARRLLQGWWFEQSLLLASIIGPSDDAFVHRWADCGRGGMLWLALQSRRCRRRVKEAALFGAACLFLAAKGWKRP